MVIYFAIFIRIVYDENVLTKGDAESGPYATSSSVTYPTEWIYFGNITQISYSAPETQTYSTLGPS
jgi:hypothetical protein